MSKYLVEKPRGSYVVCAYISVFLLIFNVYHTKLMNIMSLYSPATTVYIQAFSVALLIMYISVEKDTGIFQLKIQSTDLLLLLTLVVILASTKDLAYNFTYILRYSILILVVIMMKYDDVVPDVFFKCIMFAGLLHVFVTLWFYFDKDFYIQNIFPHFMPEQQAHLYPQVMVNNHATGLASHYSQNGIYLSIALCCIYTLFYSNSKKNRSLYISLFAVTLVALFMTGKRAVLLFIVFSMIVTYMVCNKKHAAGKIVVLVFCISLAGIILYVLSFYIDSIGATFERFYLTFFADDSIDVSNGRFLLYGIALGFFAEAPMFGIGWREFTNRVKVFYRGEDQLMDTHNVFLQLLCETGIVGFAVFLTMFVVFFIMTVKYCIMVKDDKLVLSDKMKTSLVFSLGYQIFFLCYCLTGNPLYDLETLYIYIISCGITSAVHFKVTSKKQKKEEYKSKYLL